ncbi:MAG: NUDIX domain-containing protein [Calditrichae bacterium]|nr:NUDIX domain-containing protein [Calditrichia bacterium]
MSFTKNDIFKNFTLGFIPILVFLAADYIYGPMTGIIVAIIFGLAEMIYFYIKNKQIEKFILFDIGLLVIFGGVSLVLRNELFFKIKPAVLEAILVIVLGIHGFTNTPLLLLIGKRYMGKMQILPAQQQMMKMLAKLLCVIMLFHVILIVWSAYYWSHEAWAFVSGGLFYILIAFVFGIQFFYIRFKNKKRPVSTALHDEEWFDLVDEQGRVIGKAPRSKVHGDPSLLHPTIHIHIFNKQGRLFLQKRSSAKDLFPGRWDTAVGGHVSSGENIRSAMIREAKEELGVDAAKAEPLFRYVMRNKYESELVNTFRLVSNGPFKINKEEIDQGRFWTVFEIRKSLGQNIFTPNFEQEFALLQKSGLI